MPPKIVLNMIVKNEAAIIREPLKQLRPYIDAWIICDTGSTDGTQGIIRKTLEGIVGQLYDRPWINFAANRSEALDLAEAAYPDGYALIHDADDIIDFAPDFAWPNTGADSYYFEIDSPPIRFMRTHLLRLARGWKYQGVVHEAPITLDGQPAIQGGVVQGLRYRHNGKPGARSNDPAKYAKDAALLQGAYEQDSKDYRSCFYLAQSLRDAGFLAEALRRYEERAQLGGWHEEVFVALHEAARLRERLGQSQSSVIRAYKRAWQFRPTRAEPLCDLARYCRINNLWESAYRAAKQASQIKLPNDVLFIVPAAYGITMHDELSLAAHFTGRHQEAIKHIQLARALNPNDPRLEANERFMRAKAT